MNFITLFPHLFLPKVAFIGAIVDKINKWLSDLFSDGIVANLKSMNAAVNEKLSWAGGVIGSDVSSINGSIFSYMERVHETVILPICSLIITAVLCIELISAVIDKNNMNTDSYDIWKWIFKSFCQITIAANAFKIVMAIMDVGNYLVRKVSGVVDTNASIPQDQVMENIKQGLMESNAAVLFIGFLVSFIFLILGIIIAALVMVIVYGRFIEIIVMSSVAAMPLSTILSKGASFNIGVNYTKKMAALALQGFLMMFILGCYNVLVRGVQYGGGAFEILATIGGLNILLILMLKKSDQIASSIVGA